jgi:hypothetical protein
MAAGRSAVCQCETIGLTAHQGSTDCPELTHDPTIATDEIQAALGELAAETDPALKHPKLASPASATFRANGVELV